MRVAVASSGPSWMLLVILGVWMVLRNSLLLRAVVVRVLSAWPEP